MERTDGWRDDAELSDGGKLVMEGNLTSDTDPFSLVRLGRDGSVKSELKYPTQDACGVAFDAVKTAWGA